jgi:hypothetical protein
MVFLAAAAADAVVDLQDIQIESAATGEAAAV